MVPVAFLRSIITLCIYQFSQIQPPTLEKSQKHPTNKAHKKPGSQNLTAEEDPNSEPKLRRQHPSCTSPLNLPYSAPQSKLTVSSDVKFFSKCNCAPSICFWTRQAFTLSIPILDPILKLFMFNAKASKLSILPACISSIPILSLSF